jgi:Na+/melibiose symporter-like transporter
MIEPSVFNQMEEKGSELLIRILIPLWIILSISVTIWSYKSTRARIFWKNLYKSIFPPRDKNKKTEKKWFRK